MLARVGPDALAPLALPGGLGLAVGFYLLLALLGLELPRWALRHWDHGPAHRPHDPHDDELGDPGRRHTISRVLAGTAGAVAVATTGYGYVRARTVPTRAVTVPLARLDTCRLRPAHRRAGRRAPHPGPAGAIVDG